MSAKPGGHQAAKQGLFRVFNTRMTNRMYLHMQLQKAVQKYGKNAPVTLEIKRQIQETALPEGTPTLQQFLAGFRKAKEPKRSKA